MLTTEECALAEAISDRLIELYVRRDEARQNDNWQEARHLQHQIDEIAAEYSLPARTRSNGMDNPVRTKRRHVCDKSVIDHLADKVFEPSGIPNTQRQTPTTDTGLSVEKQVQKKWDPKKGGLPTFYPIQRSTRGHFGFQSIDSSTPSRIQPPR